MQANNHLRQAVDVRMLHWLRDLSARLRESIAAFFGDEPAIVRDAEAEARAARMFAQACYENSNLEMDWLWYAANMTGDAERRYCLERAQALNPASDMAKQALARLSSPTLADDALVFGRRIDRAA
jgi:hypothetical protein